jgi:hypothetical protein
MACSGTALLLKISTTTHLWWRRGKRRKRRYSSYSFMTSALLYIEVSGQRHASAALYLREKDPRYPLDIISDISDTTVIMLYTIFMRARAEWFCLVRSFGLVSEH